MALMKLTAFNGGMKGKVAGTVFQGSVAGQVVKNSPSMAKGGLIDAIAAGSKLTKADAGRGLQVTQFVTRASSEWRGLSYADRLTWITGAGNYPFKNKFGDNYTPSGFQVFMSINVRLQLLGLDIVNTIPAAGGVLNPAAFTVAYDASSHDLRVTATAAPTGYTLLLDASKPLSAGKSLKMVTFAGIYTFDGSESFPFLFTDWYTNYFGTLPAGGTIWFRLRLVNQLNGQTGSEQFFQLNF